MAGAGIPFRQRNPTLGSRTSLAQTEGTLDDLVSRPHAPIVALMTKSITWFVECAAASLRKMGNVSQLGT